MTTSPLSVADLARHPSPLAAHYSRFRVAERLLLTGHSHQAWPDVARRGQIEAWDDAAELVDAKWDRAFEKAARVEAGFARLMDDTSGTYALGASTHDLLVRWLSALPLRDRPRLVTTDGEFHSLRRQLDRIEEEGIEIVRVPAEEPELAARLARATDPRTAAVLVSAVLFGSGRIVPDLGQVAAAAQRHGAACLVDAYHALAAMPFPLADQGLDGAYVVGGGYKYCQLGEGNCFLRVPPGCTLRPVVTGWFAEFEALEDEAEPGRVAYGPEASRFRGATYDPTSHYRAAEVFEFFEGQGLHPAVLHRISRHQVGLLAERFDALDADPAALRRQDLPLGETGGFLVLESPHAEALTVALRRRGVHTDSRGPRLRLGPAPYLSDRQLRDAMGILGEVLRTIRGQET